MHELDNIKSDYPDNTTRHLTVGVPPGTGVIALGQTRVEERTHVSGVSNHIVHRIAQIDNQRRENLGLDTEIWQQRKHLLFVLQKSQLCQ